MTANEERGDDLTRLFLKAADKVGVLPGCEFHPIDRQGAEMIELEPLGGKGPGPLASR